MRILITGVGGYIGSVLADKLTRNNDYKVHGIDKFIYNNEKSVLPLLNRPNFSVEKKDVRELGEEDLKYEVIIHLAALVGAPLCEEHPNEAKSVNYLATKRICELSSGYTQILYPNTNSGYGVASEICTEESPLKPISVYGVTKCEGEKAVLDRGHSTSFRLATVFGVSPRMRMDLMVNRFVAEMYFKGHLTIFEPHFKRNFIGINDVASAFTWGIGLEGVYNVGLDSANCTKIELANLVRDTVNPHGTVTIGTGKDPDKRDYNVSSAKLVNTGFKFNDKLDLAMLRLKTVCNLTGYKIMNEGNYNV